MLVGVQKLFKFHKVLLVSKNSVTKKDRSNMVTLVFPVPLPLSLLFILLFFLFPKSCCGIKTTT